MKNKADVTPWYAGISRYQWLVLAVASLGWAFDVFEGQIFVASMNEAMPELLPPQISALEDAARQAHAGHPGARLLAGRVGLRADVASTHYGEHGEQAQPSARIVIALP